MSWQYLETIEKEVDLSGALRVRILCEKDGVKECFFLKLKENDTDAIIIERANKFLEDKTIEENIVVEIPKCPHCGLNLI